MIRTVIPAACLVLALQAGAAWADEPARGSSTWIGIVTGEPERDTFGYRGGDLALPAAVQLDPHSRYLGDRTGDEEKDTFGRTARAASGLGQRSATNSPIGGTR